jgi:hypothetical protein
VGGRGKPVAPVNWRQVSYQRQLHYFPPGGGRTDVKFGDPEGGPDWCYGLTQDGFAHPWGTTIWFGGANGTCCDILNRSRYRSAATTSS